MKVDPDQGRLMKSAFLLAFKVMKMHPLQSGLMIFLTMFASLLEGASITLIVPLLSQMTTGDNEASFLETATNKVLGYLNVANELGPILVLMVIVVSSAAIVKFASRVQVALVAQTIARQLRSSLMSAILKASWGHSSQLSSGRISSALGIESDRASGIFAISGKMIAAGWLAAVAFSFAAMISVPFTFGGTIFGILIMALFSTFIRRTRIAAVLRRDATADMLERLGEAMSSMKAIKAMGDENRFLNYLGQNIAEVRRTSVRLSVYQQVVTIMPEPITAATLAIGLYIYIGLLSGNLESALVLAILFSRSASAIKALQRSYQSLVRQEPSYWYVDGFLRNAEDAVEAVGGTITPSYQRSISLNEVTVVYDGQTNAALSKVSLELPNRGLVAITGPSGAGKSTLINVIAGIEAPTDGFVSVDGIKLSDLNLAKWRGMLGYVPQEIVLFPTSVRENVSMGNEDHDVDDIVEVLKEVNAWRFVDKLPRGIETDVGQAGSRLSGGERQRISIARALARKPAILILDEPTASLDSATENEIGLTLKKIASHIMVLVISHRQSLVDAADIVIDLDSGTLKSFTKVQAGAGKQSQASHG
ncbi:MAG: ABC transporter ATP-binding protein [Rhodospirillaceae bacterium]|nr:ABC transporter ATP-binding protein [Rhodospirillaceae bacterium]